MEVFEAEVGAPVFTFFFATGFMLHTQQRCVPTAITAKDRGACLRSQLFRRDGNRATKSSIAFVGGVTRAAVDSNPTHVLGHKVNGGVMGKVI